MSCKSAIQVRWRYLGGASSELVVAVCMIERRLRADLNLLQPRIPGSSRTTCKVAEGRPRCIETPDCYSSQQLELRLRNNVSQRRTRRNASPKLLRSPPLKQITRSYCTLRSDTPRQIRHDPSLAEQNVESVVGVITTKA